MTTNDSRPRGVYHSRSRLTRQRALLATAGVGLLLLGYALGRWQDGDSGAPAVAVAAPLPAATTPSAGPSSPSASPAAPSDAAPPQGGRDAYTAIQAEDANVAQGTDNQDTEDQGGGRNVGWINNGDFLRFDDVNFGTAPATRFAARVASDVGNGVTGQVEVRLDSPGSPPIGTLLVGAMGGWQNWQSRTIEITPVTGLHTVFLTFACNDGTEFLNLNYFAFAH